MCGEVRRGDGAKGVVREMRLDDDRGNGDGSEVELRPDEVCEEMKASGLCTREVNRMSVTVSNQLDSKKDHDEKNERPRRYGNFLLLFRVSFLGPVHRFSESRDRRVVMSC